ncbi:hypothetical protein HDU96_009145 [Phlyctochytrium bullatum]|nr:hypothetical protein HDU96_009145 [Phlyctochytrium bullatum]
MVSTSQQQIDGDTCVDLQATSQATLNWEGDINPNDIIIQELVTANPNCTVERGSHQGLPVIVKRSTNRKIIEREIDFLRKASRYEFVVSFCGSFEEKDNGIMGLVMQRCAMDLRDWYLAATPSGDLDRKMLQISEGIVKGLAHINSLDIIHNDLKPQNVFVDQFNKPFIGDFGVATIRGEARIGYTPQYFDKESLDFIPDEKSDSWLLAATIWEFWTKAPFNVDKQVSLDGIRNYTVRGILRELFRPRAKRFTARQILDFFESTTRVVRAVHYPVAGPATDPSIQFWDAVTTGSTGPLRTILASGSIDVNSTKDGLTGLHSACRNNFVDVVEILLEFGADFRRQDGSGRLPIQLSTSVDVWRAFLTKFPKPIFDLFEAAETGDDISARLILAAETDPSVKLNAQVETRLADDVSDVALLHLAAFKGNAAVCQVFLDAGANVDVRDSRNWTPLFFAVYADRVDVVHLLLDKGADLECRLQNRDTPLSQAASAGHVEVARVLLERGADMDGGGTYKSNPVVKAVQGGHVDVLLLLLESGTDMEARRGRALLEAASCNHLKVVRLLLDKGADIESRDKDKNTPLILAAFDRHLSIAQLLLEKGADIEARGSLERTPLLEAANFDQLEVVRLLLDKGADIESRDKNKNTPLILAARSGHLPVVQLLVESGADVGAKTSFGFTARELAVQMRHSAVAEFLASVTPSSSTKKTFRSLFTR